MLSRASRFLPLVRQIGANSRAIHTSTAAQSGHILPSEQERCEHFGILMDRMPKAEGSWEENYQRKNSFYNQQIALQTVFFAVVVWWTCYAAPEHCLNRRTNVKMKELPIIFPDGTVYDPEKQLPEDIIVRGFRLVKREEKDGETQEHEE